MIDDTNTLDLREELFASIAKQEDGDAILLLIGNKRSAVMFRIAANEETAKMFQELSIALLGIKQVIEQKSLAAMPLNSTIKQSAEQLARLFKPNLN